MKIAVSHLETNFNRATRKNEAHEVLDGFCYLPVEVETQIKKLSKEYRLNLAEMVNLALCYYFGDGKNHLQCEHCDYIDWCLDVRQMGKETRYLLDKGSVVVGLPSSDLGECK